MGTRILYILSSLAHKRVFERFGETKGLSQLLLGPYPVITDKEMVPEDYGDFLMPVVNYRDFSDVQKIVYSYKPEIYVQSDLSPQHKTIKLSNNCKRVFVSHGLIGNHVLEQFGFDKATRIAWSGMDLYCGETEVFKKWVEMVSRKPKKILLNAMPQLDVLYDQKYYNECGKNIIRRACGFIPSKVILFLGFEGKDRIDFVKHNEDFYRTAIYLGRLAEKNGWLVLMKPRHYYTEMIDFLRKQKWGKVYVEEFIRLQSNKHIHVITTTGHIYRYYFADVFVLNGCSTAEIEACCIKKPLVVVRTKTLKEEYDPFNTVSCGSASLVSSENINELENKILNIPRDQVECQKKLLIALGIRFDGGSSKRVQNALMEL